MYSTGGVDKHRNQPYIVLFMSRIDIIESCQLLPVANFGFNVHDGWNPTVPENAGR
jgi:hypothetical protein